MADFNNDFDWQRRFLPEMKRICGEYLIGESPYDEDAQRNTDLIVLRLDAVRIACRVRRNYYAEKYNDEFTIRSSRPNGHKTELTKVVEGWGDYILYGFADEHNESLCAWTLGSLSVFRLWFNRQLVVNNGDMPGKPQKNKDGSSCFLAFKVSALPSEFIVARKEYLLRLNDAV